EILDLHNIQHHEFGVLDAAMGKAALAYIETACRLALDGSVQGIVTAPINKEAIKAAGSPFPGHTEMLASLLGIAEDRVFTLFVLDQLRIFFLTRHHSLADAIARIDEDGVVHALEEVWQLSRQIGIPSPHLALAALDPHAGEPGILGKEENAILMPAVERARAAGVNVSGPIPADADYY